MKHCPMHDSGGNRTLCSVVKLLCCAVISIVVLLNQPVIASEESESPQDLIREGEVLRDIIQEPDPSFYIQRYSESL